jgi:hypothetical protein
VGDTRKLKREAILLDCGLVLSIETLKEIFQISHCLELPASDFKKIVLW